MVYGKSDNILMIKDIVEAGDDHVAVLKNWMDATALTILNKCNEECGVELPYNHRHDDVDLDTDICIEITTETSYHMITSESGEQEIIAALGGFGVYIKSKESTNIHHVHIPEQFPLPEVMIKLCEEINIILMKTLTGDSDSRLLANVGLATIELMEMISKCVARLKK